MEVFFEANKKCVNYLDITLDLRSSTYKPFMKPGNTPLYVNYDSNHPPSVLRGLPDAINKRLSNISSDTRSFDSAAPPYQEALKKSGFDYNLKYNPQPPPGKMPNRKCRVPGHSNKKRQPTERNLRWTDRRPIQDKIQQPHELVQK